MSDLIGGPWRSGRQDMVSYTMAEGEDAGPWKNVYGNDRAPFPNAPKNMSPKDFPLAVARVYGKTEEQALARARLIAVAPEMYELLGQAEHVASGVDGVNVGSWVDSVRALLARIDGKDPP